MTMVGKIDTDMAGKTLVLMIGLPYSGKSHRIRSGPLRDTPVVSPDAIRVSLHGQRFLPSAERMVSSLAHYMVEALFLAGHEMVVLDATNVTEKRRIEWEGNWRLDYVCVETPIEVCLERAKAAGDDDIVPTIIRMASALVWPS